MKKSEIIALWVMVCLAIVTAILGLAVFKYGTVCFWAGLFGAGSQTLLAALAWWGLRLAGQQASLVEEATAAKSFTPIAPLGTFHMSYSDDAARIVAPPTPVEPEDITTLDTGFQRVVIALAALLLMGLSAIAGWMVYRNFAAVLPGKPIVISPVAIDPGAVVAAAGTLLLYFIMMSFSRVAPESEGYGEAANGIALLGLPGALVLAAAICAAWAGISYATQAAAIFIAAVMFLQALELGINALRNYGAIEEIDQAGLDLQQLPLVPLLSSGWIVGVRVLLGESIGWTRDSKTAPGVLARLLPRIVLAGIAILLGLSTLHIVPTGDVGIREHLGTTTAYDLQHPLPPGLHVLWPWPVDELQFVPTARLNKVDVGTEEAHKSKLGEAVFSFWSSHESIPGMEFMTGDVNAAGASSSELLDGFVFMSWRVKNPGLFFHNISNKNIIEYGNSAGTGDTAHVRRMDQALVHQVFLSSISQVFAVHSLQQIMQSDIQPVADQIRAMAQKQLDSLGAGIEIEDVDIKDIHPPKGFTTMTAHGKQLGPAAAFENVVSMREFKHMVIARAKQERFKDRHVATGAASSEVARAQAYETSLINTEEGRAAAILARSKAFAASHGTAANWEFYQVMGKIFASINKVVLGPDVTPPEIWQIGHRSSGNINVPPPSGPPGGLGNPIGMPSGQNPGGG